MAYRRRARVAARYSGFRVDQLSATDVAIYDELIRQMDAEASLRAGGSPEQVGRAVATLTDNEDMGLVAEANAILEQARRDKGF